MELEKQVCSLEYAKRFEAHGIKRESYFTLEETPDGCIELFHSKATSCSNKYYRAYTVAELGEMFGKIMFVTELSKNSIEETSCIIYESNDDNMVCNEEYGSGNTEADARAASILYLIKKGYIKIKDLNK